ncbi:PTS sugar transporter subunit IIA [Wielerella bovis]|uniref:PTS sugar transporter subunit IIA n=1 Tax=Wielerella bovis TaxID=2917790 RepID=UPI00201899A8|nr:PTS mannose transporter subunit IIA [Wielerella bovis]MCG7658038.1 PTS mannose transporter subunit IIA [Wielerella bovis]MCG7660260.1 PTS mannose transporter subunit IIA [Wielerella bovis]
MISLLIITHETLGAAYTTIGSHFFAGQDLSHVHILNVQNNDDHQSIINRAYELLSEINRGHGVLILTDIFGATPCNAAMKMIVPQQSAMISGLNAPMLIKAMSYAPKETDLIAFTETVKQAGINGIMAFTENTK